MEQVRIYGEGVPPRPPLLQAPSISELAERYRGREIVIVGNGPTGRRNYSSLGLPLWVVNGGWRAHSGADLCWMMDDLEGPAWDLVGTPAQPREVWEPITQACPVPIVTSVAYREKFPQSVEFPLAAALARFPKGAEGEPRVYFAESICYAVAWAILIEVKTINLGGCDYGTIRPAERAGLEYWIGRAEEAGIPVKVFPGSQLLQTGRLDGKNRHIPGLYGFDDWPAALDGARGYDLGDFPAGTGMDDTDARLGHEALDALLREPGIESVLDVGCGAGDHAREMATAGKRVVAIDLLPREGFNNQHNGGSVFFLEADYMKPEGAFANTTFAERFDAVWSCHVLEHVDNPQAMLRRMFNDLKDGGLLALTVPPAQHAAVGGHFTLWNAGLLLYHLVRASFDCREARVKQYGYNLSVLLRKRPHGEAITAEANYPMSRLKHLLPESLPWDAAGAFNGDIRELNWT